MLGYQDHRMRHQPNAIHDKIDGVNQLSSLVALRALVRRFWNRHSRAGPFVLNLTDMHKSNIFVDNDWNITGLIDLECAPVRPIQMMSVPFWLTDRGKDQLVGSKLDEYKVQYDEFVEIFEEEEEARQLGNTHSQELREDWSSGRLWYTMALDSINAFPALFDHHLQPRFYAKQFLMGTQGLTLARLWDESAEALIDKKVEDDARYEERIREIFAAAARATGNEVTEEKRSR